MAIVALASYACQDEAGAWQGDAIFEEVTEGRQHQTDLQRKKDPKAAAYSACTDLFSWCAEALGCTDEQIVNRNDDGGRRPWVTGGGPTFIQNAPGYVYASRAVRAGQLPGVGAALVLLDPWHVAILAELDLERGVCVVYEYGQFGTAPHTQLGAACGQKHTHAAKIMGTQLVIKGRVVGGWLPVEALPLSKPALMPDDFAGTLAQ